MTDITELTPRRKTKKHDDGQQKAAKPAQAYIFNLIAKTLDRNNPVNTPPEAFYPETYKTVAPSPGVKEVLEILPHDVVRYVAFDRVAETIMRGGVKAGEPYLLTAKQALEAAKSWAMNAESMPEPPGVRFLSEDGPTFHRLPFDPARGDTPLWAEILNRMSNAKAFVAFVGSLFDPAADRQQYLWLYGDGSDSKGAISRFLRRCLGGSFRAEETPGRESRFWTHGLLGARLICFSDTNAKGFPASGLFKTLSGGDAVRVEKKGGSSFTADLIAKFMFLSNEKPQLSSERADLRRAIFCSLKTITGAPDPTYEGRLWEEAPAFVHACLEHYRTTVGPGAVIPVEREELEAHVADVEEEYETALYKYFMLGGERRGADVGCYTTAGEFQAMLTDAFANHRERAEFRKYLQRKHGISCGVAWDAGLGRAVRRYCGIVPMPGLFL